MSVTSWFLISSSGTRHRLPREMIFVGRDDCELMLQSRSVDKQHAVINYDSNADEHMVKDLGSLNGTFVNDLRIPDQTYITLKLSDVIRFGYDVYILEKSQHKVPEEALKHEKYTSQLQLGVKSLEAKLKEKQHFQTPEKGKDTISNVKLQDKGERRAQSLAASTETPISRPTPLYGQPSWWGEDEDQANTNQNNGGKMPEQETPESPKDASRYEVNHSQSDSQVKSMLSFRREPSYFEIPTKELQQRPTKKQESQVHEVPTKDTTQSIPSTQPVVQSHASFTIEFDECTPGKMKIKDHVTKFAYRQSRKQLSTEVATAPTEVVSSESKVADWLVQSNASMMVRRRSQGENMHNINSHSSELKITNANRSENGSYSETGHPTINGNDFLLSEPQNVVHVSPTTSRTSPDLQELLSNSPSQSLSSHGKSELQQTFVIEFFDDNSRKRRSQSFTNPTASPEPVGLQHQQEKANKTSSPAVERHVPSASSSATPPTQRYTIPLKDSDLTGFRRAGSLRREKTEDRISTGFSSRSSSSSAAVRPFSSVGRKSKLAKEFVAERLKREKSSPSLEKSAFSSPTATQRRANVVFQSDQTSTSPPPLPPPPPPPPSDGHHRQQTSSPVNQPVPLKTPAMPTQNVEVRSPRKEEDNLSDAGTYTIEGDVQDKEVEEARSKIDQVFGVVESPEPMNQSDAETSAAFRPVIDQGREEYRHSSSGEVMPAPEQGHSQGQPAAAGVQGAPKWMSCWASLADSYTESGPSSGLFDIPSQMELSGGARGTVTHRTTHSQHQNSSYTDDSRARRILPHLPQKERSDLPTPSIHVHCNPSSTFVMENSGSAAPRSQDDAHRLTVQDDLEPDSLSDASRSDDGSSMEKSRRRLTDAEEKLRLAVTSTAFYIGSEEEESKPQHGGLKVSSPKPERKPANRTFSTTTLTKQKGIQDSETVRSNASQPVLGHRAPSPESKEAAAPSLIRQESFTKDKPSNARLPNISSLPVERVPDPRLFLRGSTQDTHSYLKQTEDVLAVLEAKLQARQSEIAPSPMMDSLSGDSDVDTSSTVSQNSDNNKPNSVMTQPAPGGLHSDTFSTNKTSQDSDQSEKLNSYELNSSNKTEPVRKPVGLRRSTGKSGSTDLSDDPQSLPYSDQESSSNQTQRKYTVPLQKEDGKGSKVAQALSRTSSLSAPRPTRASMLRRARLGEASDNEGTETDKLSQESNNAPAKQTQEAKKLSRLDMLAMPRRRAGSFNSPSDTEASSTSQWTSRSSGSSNRATDLTGGTNQKASSGVKPGERPQKAVLSKAPVTRSRSNSAKYASSTASSRRRQKGSDYTSTSDEEYDSSWTSLKQKRSQPSSASYSPRSQPRPQPVVAHHPKPSSRDSEEENHEGEAFHSWSAHSAEIARLSQDLAKDLAILAREIHDVAGDGDPKTLAVEPSALVAHEQQVPQSGLNRVQRSSAPKMEPDQKSSDHEQNSHHPPRNKDEVCADSLLLGPVHQVAAAIRGNTEQLVDKIKLLFQDRVDVWDETVAKIKSDGDAAVGKSSNKEVTSILRELRTVQIQLEVLNAVMEPRGTVEATKTSSSSSSSSEARSSRTPLSRDWRTVHSISRRGGGPRPSGSIRRAAVTPDDLREGFVV